MTGEWPSYSSGEELLALVLICTAINQQNIVVMNIIIVLLLLLAILQWKEARRNAYNAYPYTYKLAIGKIVEQPRLPWPAVLSSDGSAWENAGTPHSTGGRRREILYSIPDCCRTYFLIFIICLFLLMFCGFSVRSFVETTSRQLGSSCQSDWESCHHRRFKLCVKIVANVCFVFFSFSCCGNMSINNCATP